MDAGGTECSHSVFGWDAIVSLSKGIWILGEGRTNHKEVRTNLLVTRAKVMLWH